ncbi:POK9 protein, partial [Pterocles burchelli]|nr:POK9 protein [Pterocles burchelli]
SGSTGMDVATATTVTLTDPTVHKIPLNAQGPLGHGLSALLLGRSSATLRGVFVLPGVIGADCTGPVHAVVWTPAPPVLIPVNSRIAQLILFVGQAYNADQVKRWSGSFGSTGLPAVLWVQAIQSHYPMLTCHLNNSEGKPHSIKLQGMIDTGADVTVIS